jgi:single-strand DNA-binding protein
MARGLNKVMLIGNLGADPEVRYTTGDKAVANVRLATAESWRDRDSGETQERTEWHRVVFFGRLAEIVNEYLRKGAQIYVEGTIRTNKWQDRDGNDRYTTEVIASEMQMLGGRPGGTTPPAERSANPPPRADNSERAAPRENPAAAPSPQREREEAPMGDFDDDIPF